jgi:hypothetical protein
MARIIESINQKTKKTRKEKDKKTRKIKRQKTRKRKSIFFLNKFELMFLRYIKQSIKETK